MIFISHEAQEHKLYLKKRRKMKTAKLSRSSLQDHHFYEDLVKRTCKLFNLEIIIEKVEDKHKINSKILKMSDLFYASSVSSTFIVSMLLKSFPNGFCVFKKNGHFYNGKTTMSLPSEDPEEMFKKIADLFIENDSIVCFPSRDVLSYASPKTIDISMIDSVSKLEIQLDLLGVA